VLFIDDDEPEIFQRREDGAPRADDDLKPLAAERDCGGSANP